MKKSVTKDDSKKTIFKNFAEYWHFTKNLPEYHKILLAESLSKNEHDFLKKSFEEGGWSNYMWRNCCDEILDNIKKESGIDVLFLRIKIISGKSQLVHKSFWDYVTTCFKDFHWKHISYIFDGLKVEPFDKDYLKISKNNESSQK